MSNAEFWDKVHGRDERRWLTGSSIKSYRTYHQIGSFKGNVLEVGVGLANASRQIAKEADSLTCVDISQHALDRVTDIADTVLVENISQLPRNFFDLAISHLVSQHVDDDMLLCHLRGVIPALKSGGVFSLQFAGGEGVRRGQEWDLQKIGEVVRTEGFVLGLVTQAGGEVVETLPPQRFRCLEQHGGWITWHVMKIRRIA